MIKNYLLHTMPETYPVLFLLFIVLFFIMIISLLVSVVFSVILRIITIKDRDVIFAYFINHTPDVFKPWLNMQFGGWVLNMTIPFSPFWSFKLLEKLEREQVTEWRNVVKDSFGKKYVIFKIRLVSTQILLIIAIPILILSAIELYLTK